MATLAVQGQDTSRRQSLSDLLRQQQTTNEALARMFYQNFVVRPLQVSNRLFNNYAWPDISRRILAGFAPPIAATAKTNEDDAEEILQKAQDVDLVLATFGKPGQ